MGRSEPVNKLRRQVSRQKVFDIIWELKERNTSGGKGNGRVVTYEGEV